MSSISPKILFLTSIPLSLLLVLIWLTLLMGRNSSNDLLAYTTSRYGSKTPLMLYDPRYHRSVPLFADMETPLFDLSADGRIAFTSTRDGNAEVYIWDTHQVNSAPINISQQPKRNDYFLSWSRDGHDLAFLSYQESGKETLIYIWDGRKLIDITPGEVGDNPESYREASWSADGRLAFTVGYGSTSGDQPSEIYLWDGSRTVNLSQDPTREDRSPTWSADGRLAFVSVQGEAYRILLWDGVSFKNGAPDRDSFTNVAPELVAYYSLPTWTNTGSLAFESAGVGGIYSQIYTWDTGKTTDISQNPGLHNTSARWSSDGRWAFTTVFSSLQLIYVRDADDHPLLTTKGQYTPAWSSDGDLAFCRPGWILSLWDGSEIRPITEGYVINAQWQSGSRVFCSSG